MAIANGVYKLKKRIKNPNPSEDYRQWMSCPHLPPADGEWDGSPEVPVERFLIVVQDVNVLGRPYREAVQVNGWQNTGFFIDQVPSHKHFPGLTEESFQEHGGYSDSHSSEPAPQEFLDALVQVKGRTLEETMRRWNRYKGLDRNFRLEPSRWANTALQVALHECRNDPEFNEKFLRGLRRLLLRDSEEGYTHDVVIYTEDGKPDKEKIRQNQQREVRKILERQKAQWEAFNKLDEDERRKGYIR